MSELEIPPWMVGWKPAPPREKPPEQMLRPPGNPKWVKGMKSPNPDGRPVGSNAQTLLVKKMLENADGILDAIIGRALEGDASSASLILSRIVPVLKSQAEKVQFEFDATAPVSQQAEAIIAAIADGTVPPDIGRQILDAVGTLGEIRAMEQLEARVAALEEASG